MKLEFSVHILKKYTNAKFRENTSSEGRVVPCGRTDVQRDMQETVVAFGNFANALKTVSGLLTKS